MMGKKNRESVQHHIRKDDYFSLSTKKERQKEIKSENQVDASSLRDENEYRDLKQLLMNLFR